MEVLELAFQLLVAHAVLDFVLQPDVMAAAKNPQSKLHADGNREFPAWYYWMGSHSLGHGGAVYLITGSLWLGLIEVVLHALIDYSKCSKRTSLAQDQALHLLCKVGYIVFLLL